MPEYHITWTGSKLVEINDEFVARVEDESEAFILGWDMLMEAGHLFDADGHDGGRVHVEYVHE